MTNEQKNEHARINGHCRISFCDCGGILPNVLRDTSVDEPYTFGRPLATYIGSERAHARLLVLRGKVRDIPGALISIRELESAGIAS